MLIITRCLLCFLLLIKAYQMGKSARYPIFGKPRRLNFVTFSGLENSVTKVFCTWRKMRVNM